MIGKDNLEYLITSLRPCVHKELFKKAGLCEQKVIDALSS